MTAAAAPGHGNGRGWTIFWLALALAGMASVLVLNGGPTFYFDTIGYVSQGKTALLKLGVISRDTMAGGVAGAGVVEAAIDGSRSPSYSVLAGIFSAIGALEGLLLANVIMVFAASGLACRLMIRTYGDGQSALGLSAMALAGATLGSLPFYVAYLMPDLLTPVMIIALSTLAVFGGRMRWCELLVAFLLGAFAINSHLSNVAIGTLIFLAAIPVALMMGRPRTWVGPLIIMLVLGSAYAQQAAFRVAARAMANAEVTIRPFLTARLIQDGPGYRWLEEHCPDANVPTCKLWTALQISSDPYRLTATHIVFEHSQRLGSFQLMSDEDKVVVAGAQVDFAKDVALAYPVATMTAFLRNVLQQGGMFAIDMTLPFEQVETNNAPVTGALTGPLKVRALHADQPWVDSLTRVHGMLYSASLAFVLTIIVLPGALPRGARLFALMILGGILANAAVCGGISQPSTRYGSRVIWLLPYLAVLLWALAAWAPGRWRDAGSNRAEVQNG